MAETCLCCTSHLSVSRRPDEIKFEVYPRKMVVFSPVSASRQVRCNRGQYGEDRKEEKERQARQEECSGLHTMPLTISTACPIDVAWNPTLARFSTSSATVTLRSANASKSSPLTGTAPAGTGSDGLSTALAAPAGASCCSGWLWEAMRIVLVVVVRTGIYFEIAVKKPNTSSPHSCVPRTSNRPRHRGTGLRARVVARQRQRPCVSAAVRSPHSIPRPSALPRRNVRHSGGSNSRAHHTRRPRQR